MKLPFAVYTARQGYAWQSGLQLGRESLEKFRKAIGKMPEFDFGEPARRGLANVQDDVVAYRFMRQSKADAAGRDASYLALTVFSREQARFVDADALFANPPFQEPLLQPPSEFDYQGGPAVPCDFALPPRSASGYFASGGALSSAGFVFSQIFSGTFRIHLQESPQTKPMFEYAPPVTASYPASGTSAPRPMGPAVSTVIPAAPPVILHSDEWKAVAIAAIVFAFIEAAVIAWLFLASYRAEPPQTEMRTQQEPPAPAALPEPPTTSTQQQKNTPQPPPPEPAAPASGSEPATEPNPAQTPPATEEGHLHD